MLASSTVHAPLGGSDLHVSAREPGDLMAGVRLVAGFTADIDLASPDQWSGITVAAWAPAYRPLLVALTGVAAAARLKELHDRVRSASVDENVPVGLAPSGAWRRVGAVDALDRWLQLPLDQSLIDAERGVARFRAADELAPGVLREGLIVDALPLVRSAASGVQQYLAGLRAIGCALPSGLFAALGQLAAGYRGLLAEVRGRDRALSGVVDAWSELAELGVQPAERPAESGGRRSGPVENRAPAPPAAASSVVDPRQVRARVLALGADPARAEVHLTGSGVGDDQEVLVSVPAFGPEPALEIIDRLKVRLVERRSGRPAGEGLLTLLPEHPLRTGAPDGAGRYPRLFQGVVALHGLAFHDVRADVFDADSEVPPASADTDADLQRARRAAVFLRDWRRLAAEALLRAPVEEPARRLAALARTLAPTPGLAGRPTFHGGPSDADLLDLSRLGDASVLARFRTPGRHVGGSPILRWLAGAHGTSAPLAAELAAAHRPS